jgi:hypothetical protein
MPIQKTEFPVGWSTQDLEEVDREIARMALLCEVKLLDPGVVRRVLKKDESVCGAANSLAFSKLRDLLMLHLAIRDRSAETFGQAVTARVENDIVARLQKSFPNLSGKWPPPN